MVDSQTLSTHLLGGFRIRAGPEPVAGLDQARLQELLAYLLLHYGRPTARQRLAFLFWPDSTEKQARTNIRNLWHRLRRTLPDADYFLAADDLAIQWRSDAPCWLDVAEFEARLTQARTAADADDQVQQLEQAVALYGGELLVGCYSEWLLVERERLPQAYGHALSQLAALYEARRHYRRVVDHARALLRHDPLHEPAYRQLMPLHALNEDNAAALHTYHTCATTLRRELDVEPGRPTRELYEQLLNAVIAPFAPAPLGVAVPLVGRDAEWSLLQQTWRRAANRPRLVLIAGEAGNGKICLAEALVDARRSISSHRLRLGPPGRTLCRTLMR
jgi:DNA-binding SARP family transcriptional activator